MYSFCWGIFFPYSHNNQLEREEREKITAAKNSNHSRSTRWRDMKANFIQLFKSHQTYRRIQELKQGDRGSTVVKVLCYKSEGRWFDSSWCQLEFFIGIISLRSPYGRGVNSASNRNEYQEYLLGGKDGRCLRLTTLPVSCAVVMKSGNLKFLELSGPLQASNGTDLAFYRK